MFMGYRIFVWIIGLVVFSLSAEIRADNSRVHYYKKTQPGEPKLLECDILVYGGTPAGVAAAIQAGGMGKKVRDNWEFSG